MFLFFLHTAKRINMDSVKHIVILPFNGKLSFGFQYSEDMKHKTTLLELQKMFTYLMVCLRIVYEKLIRYALWPKQETLNRVYLYRLCPMYSYFSNWICHLVVFIIVISQLHTSCYCPLKYSFSVTGPHTHPGPP